MTDSSRSAALLQSPLELLSGLSLELGDPRHLRRVLAEVRRLQSSLGAFLEMDVTADLDLEQRQRLECFLMLSLVVALGTGIGDVESRVRATQRLYLQNLRAPAEAVAVAASLLRSRLVSGATDVETFWLAAAFAHPLAPLVERDLSELAWRYLCHAPFALDPFTALRFASLSRRVRCERRPRWPLDLIDQLFRSSAHADLAATLLEGLICSQLQVRTVEQAGFRLASRVLEPGDLLTAGVRLLADYYVRVDADHVPARDVVRAAARSAPEVVRYSAFLNSQLFSLPHEELYRLVSDRLHRPADLDSVYRAYVAADQLGVARRLVECELVRRLSPWHFGPIQPQLRRAVKRTIGGADLYYPRIRELATRLSILHSRTRLFTEEGLHLASRVALLPHYADLGEAVGPLRKELRAYLAESDPHYLLRREREVLLDRWEELSSPERNAIDAAHRWMAGRARSRLESLKEFGDATPASTLDLLSGADANGELEWAFEHALWTVYQRLFRPAAFRGVRDRIESLTGRPYAQAVAGDVSERSALARSFAYQDRSLALVCGGLAGLMGGRWGMIVDIFGMLSLSAHGVARIGACFGIAPGTRAGFQFLLDGLTMSYAARAGDGLVAYLADQRPRFVRALVTGGVLYTSGRVRRVLATHEGERATGGLGERVRRAARALARVARERKLLASVPVLGGLVSAGADYYLLRELTEAALHLGARHWVLSHHGLLLGAESEASREDQAFAVSGDPDCPEGGGELE